MEKMSETNFPSCAILFMTITSESRARVRNANPVCYAHTHKNMVIRPVKANHLLLLRIQGNSLNKPPPAILCASYEAICRQYFHVTVQLISINFCLNSGAHISSIPATKTM